MPPTPIAPPNAIVHTGQTANDMAPLPLLNSISLRQRSGCVKGYPAFVPANPMRFGEQSS